MLGPLFKTIANWIDRKACRAVFGVIAGLAALLLGPFAVLLIAGGPREPWLFLIGLIGAVGLIGGVARVWLGRRFFGLSLGTRVAIAMSIGAGVAVSFLAAFALPGSIYWATVPPVVGSVGLVLLAGSIAGTGAGPNYSFKPTPSARLNSRR